MRPRMVFVVGARRSGTLWVQRILAAHPRVSAVPTETYLFSYGLSQVFDRLQHGLISSPRVASVYADRDEVVAATRDLCDVVFRRFAVDDDGLVVERTPWHAHHLELIGEVYPDAHVLHAIRDGRDVARSLVAQRWGPETISEAATEWRDTVEAGRRGGNGNPLYREVRYEELLVDPLTGARDLYEWLGLDASQEALEAARAASVDRQNLGAGSTVGVAKWKREWSARDLAEFEAEAGALLEELGYEREELPRLRLPRLRRKHRDDDDRRPEAPRPESLDEGALEPQRLVEDTVAAVCSGSGRLRELLATEATVRIVDGDGTSELGGERGLTLLEQEVAGDPAFAGRQIVGRSFPAVPSTTVALVLELPDGERAVRTLVVRVADGKIAELTLIRTA